LKLTTYHPDESPNRESSLYITSCPYGVPCTLNLGTWSRMAWCRCDINQHRPVWSCQQLSSSLRSLILLNSKLEKKFEASKPMTYRDPANTETSCDRVLCTEGPGVVVVRGSSSTFKPAQPAPATTSARHFAVVGRPNRTIYWSYRLCGWTYGTTAYAVNIRRLKFDR
jgi:hypothetical protein